MSNQVIYIPEYVEQGVAKLTEAKKILVQIEADINSGLSTIGASGYNRGIPHIEKGSDVQNAISTMDSTIDTITTEIVKYSNGEALELENAIIVANPDTIAKYGLKKEDIDFTLSDYILKSDEVAANPTVQAKWASNYLTAAAGNIIYTGKDGRLTKETWCDLNPNNLAKLMREKHGIELDFWIREDGVYMYGDYVMVAADIPHMDGTEQAAEYRKGDLVETSLGTGMVVDLCGMAEKTRKGQTEVDVWYDIYTAWHDGGTYQHVGYCKTDGCTDARHTKRTMVRKAENPTQITTQLRSESVFNNNGQASANANAQTNATIEQATTGTTTLNNTNNSQTVFNTNTTNTNNTTNANTNTQTNTGTGTYGTNAYTNNTFNSNTANTTYTPSTNSGSSYTGSGSYSSGGGYSGGGYSGGGYTPSTSSTSTPSSNSTLTSIYDVNGFTKPSVNQQTPPVSTSPAPNPVVSTPITTTPPVSTTPVVTTPTTPVTPEVNTNDLVIESGPVQTPIVNQMPEIDNTPTIDNEIVDIPTPEVDKVLSNSNADTPIENNSNNSGLAVAAVAALGTAAAGIGAKVYFDKRKENQDNGEYEDEEE